MNAKDGKVLKRGVEVRVFPQEGGGGFGGPHAGAAEVVVAIAFDVRDAEGSHDGEVLEEGDGADVAEVFAAEEAAMAVEEGEVEQAFGEAFAVFVAGAGVAEGEGEGEIR